MRNNYYYHGDHFGPLPFRRAHKPPVVGGRWKIRRLRGNSGKPWRAYTSGTASRFNRYFTTHAEAIQHAQMIARMLADPTPDRVEATIRRVYPRISDEHVATNVLRYSAAPEAPEGYRWVSCAQEYGWASSRDRHLIRKGKNQFTTLCGHSANDSTIWRGNSTKTVCADCVREVSKTGKKIVGQKRNPERV